MGKYFQKYLIIEIAHTLHITLHAGTPLVVALELTIDAINNYFIKQQLSFAYHKIKQGMTLNTAFLQTRLFPSTMIQLLKTGEYSASLEMMLKVIILQQQAELQQFIRKSSQLIEPITIIFLGIIIAFIIIGLYLPIFQLGHHL